MLEFIDPCQLQQRFGGTAPNLDGQPWPPKMPSFECGSNPEKLVPLEEYEDFINSNPDFRRMPVIPGSDSPKPHKDEE